MSSINQKNIEIALQYMMQFAGTWYTWGGDDPSGFDCSGLAVEYLKALGAIPRKVDRTARELACLYANKELHWAERGGLVFFGKLDKVDHVEISLNSYLTLGASGGGSFIKNISDAIKYNAFVKLRPIIQSRVVAYAHF